MQEHRDKTCHAYDYCVTEIGLPISEPSTADALDKPNNADRSKSYPLAKVLQDVEKSYDKGKKILDESENLTEDNIRLRLRDIATPKKMCIG